MILDFLEGWILRVSRKKPNISPQAAIWNQLYFTWKRRNNSDLAKSQRDLIMIIPEFVDLTIL